MDWLILHLKKSGISPLINNFCLFIISVYKTSFFIFENKFENFLLLKCSFYKLQAYHVELNAYSDGCRQLANIQEKWMK